MLQVALLSQRGRAMLHASLYSVNSTMPRAQSFILVTSASDLQLQTIKFCSVVFGVTSKLRVINKIHCMIAAALSNAKDGRRINAITYTPLSKCWQHPTVQQWLIDAKARYWSKISIFGPVRVSLSEYCHNVWYEKTTMVLVKKWRCVYSFRQNPRTWQTDGRTPHDGIGRAY